MRARTVDGRDILLIQFDSPEDFSRIREIMPDFVIIVRFAGGKLEMIRAGDVAPGSWADGT